MTAATVQISMSAEEHHVLGAIAHKRGSNRSAVMRHAFRLYMQLQEMENNGDLFFAQSPCGERQLKLIGFEPNTPSRPRIVDTVPATLPFHRQAVAGKP